MLDADTSTLKAVEISFTIYIYYIDIFCIVSAMILIQPSRTVLHRWTLYAGTDKFV